MKQTLQILVVEDDTTMRHSIRELLEHDGHQVSPVANGESALEKLADNKYDLVVTDFLMPGIHGDELVASIRKLVPAQAILMVTAFVNEFKKYGRPSGEANALLMKPFTLEQLQAAVKQALGQG